MKPSCSVGGSTFESGQIRPASPLGENKKGVILMTDKKRPNEHGGSFAAEPWKRRNQSGSKRTDIGAETESR